MGKRAKGALSDEQLNLGWPHRVRTPVNKDDIGWSRLHGEMIAAVDMAQGHTLRGGSAAVIAAFANAEHAIIFKRRFGGERTEIVAEYRTDKLGWTTSKRKGFRTVTHT